ncbi:hypothetical protein BDB01DRAFT_788960 [Pilobolus umbonatus]|nr:hypothetical protein BDB01DRAFT_788960 [Pilobolus umbonatus]
MAKPFPFNEYPIVLGIDFGTTYSGVSYAFRNDNELNSITKWPNQLEYGYPKAPTSCLYDNTNRTLRYWGKTVNKEKQKPQTGNNYTVLNLFKLYLDEELLPKLTPLPLNLTITQVIADYLRHFYDFVKVSLKKKGFPNGFEKQVRFCLTVPAMWSNRSKNIMREAAILAHLIEKDDHHDRLMLISEPEAAALYCEKTCDKFTMKNGDEFMICDAGGGTLDLITFRVEVDANGNRKFRESTKGIGESCGSTFIDHRFRKFIRRKLHRVVRKQSINNKAHIPEEPLNHMIDVFIDTIKPSFDGTEDQYIDVAMGFDLITKTSEAVGLNEGKFVLTVDELKNEVFDPVVNSVVKLCCELEKETSNLKAIFMVGGFGSSSYLHKQMEKEFKPRNISIIQPERPEMAVTRGAVIFGMNPNMIATRIPRSWYGIATTGDFKHGEDPVEFKFIGPDGRVQCDNKFSTYVRRGEPLDMDSCVAKVFNTFYPSRTACTFYSSESETEPKYIVSTPEISVKKVFDFEIPMPVLPHLQYGDRVALTIKMYFGEVELRVEAIIEDVTYDVVCNFDA